MMILKEPFLPNPSVDKKKMQQITYKREREQQHRILRYSIHDQVLMSKAWITKEV